MTKPDGREISYCTSVNGCLCDTHFHMFFCPLWHHVWVTEQQNQTQPERHSPSPAERDFTFGVISAAHQTNRCRRGPVLPRTLSAVWYTHACAIGTAQGLITWHTCMTSSACNQIHMSPSPCLSLSLSGILSLFLSTRDFVSTFLFLLVFLLSLLLSCLSVFLSSNFFFFFLFLGLSMGFAVKMERDFDCQAQKTRTLAGLLWPKSVFTAILWLKTFLFVVVMTCCTVQVVVIPC